MDCEKFDQILVDALYDELDDLTLATAKRHADGCQRCRTAWSGLKATRKVGTLPLVEAPESLENRILSRARDAHRNVSWPRRVGRAVSWAGAVAMRPQTAMAALLVLMLTTSLLVIRPKPDRSGASSRVSITEQGVPQHAPDDRPVDRATAQSRGTMPAPPAAIGGPLAGRDEVRGKGAEPPVAMQAAPAARPPAAVVARGEDLQATQSPPAEAARAAKTKAANDPFAETPREATEGETAAPIEEPAGAAESPKAAAAPDFDRKREASGGGSTADPYAAAMALYSAGRFAEAERAFSAVAASGGKNAPYAALYAAKSTEANLGCGSAAAKFESVASRYGATSAGAEALWGAAGCYKTLGIVDKARSLYMTLRSVAGYRDRAEAELANLALRQQAPAARGAAKPAAARK
jgi:TolA-binding protein